APGFLERGAPSRKVVTVRTKEERFGKYGWLQRVVPSYRYQTSANKGHRTQAIQGSQLPHGVQDNNRSAGQIGCLDILTLRTTHRPAVMGLYVTYHGFDPFQMTRGQHEEEIREVPISRREEAR